MTTRGSLGSAVALLCLALAIGIGVRVAETWGHRRACVTATIRPPASPPPRLVDATEDWGLRRPAPAPLDRLLPETLAGGCALFDADGDGDVDVLLTHGRTWLRAEQDGEPTLALYSSDGHGQFTDVTADSGLETPIRALGVAVADQDGDGHVDVFVTCAGANRLFRGLGGGRFEDTTAAAGVAGDPRDWSTGCVWLDHDGDTDLDLFVGHLARVDGDQPGERASEMRQLATLPAAHPTLWRNDGDGTFTDVSGPAGVQVVDRVTGEEGSRVLGVAALDLDADGRTDILLACFGGEDRHLWNRGGGEFSDRADESHLGFDALGNAMGSTGVALLLAEDAQPACAVTRVERGALALHVRRGSGCRYEDQGAGLPGGASAFHSFYGVGWPDLDLDGLADLCLVGGTAPGLTAPRLLAGRLEVRLGLSPHEPELFMHGVVDTSALRLPPDARGLAHGDLDGDGDPDLLVTSAFGPMHAIRNDRQSGNRWLRVVLRGRAPNTSAIGARLQLRIAGTLQTRTVMSGGGYLSQSELTQTFAVGRSAHAEELSVTWPDGTSSTHPSLEPGRVHEIRQP